MIFVNLGNQNYYMNMKRFEYTLTLILLALIILHLSFTIDYSDLYQPENKGGATGVMICLLGLVSLWLSSRKKAGRLS